jgi:hypothetical protein
LVDVIIVYCSGGLPRQRVGVQSTVKPTGFAIVVPLVLSHVGGWSAVAAVNAADARYWASWRLDATGMMNLALLTPAFIVSRDCCRKCSAPGTTAPCGSASD